MHISYNDNFSFENSWYLINKFLFRIYITDVGLGFISLLFFYKMYSLQDSYMLSKKSDCNKRNFFNIT